MPDKQLFNHLHIDVETYSSEDLKTCGVYRYVEAVDFEILIFAFAFNDEPVKVVDLASGEKLHPGIIAALIDPRVVKHAHNAAFERAAIRAHFGINTDPAQWVCTMVQCTYSGLPAALGAAAKVLGLAEQKDAAGAALIKLFSVPCKPSAANGQRRRNLPSHYPDKWAEYVGYCVQDVVTERAISKRINEILPAGYYPDREREVWVLDQKINDIGVRVDVQLARNAININACSLVDVTDELVRLTSLQNPNSPAQLKKWLSSELDENVSSLTKAAIDTLLSGNIGEAVARVLALRIEAGKTSVTKYQRAISGACGDDRLRGLHQYYGGARTGRWAGRMIQPHNLPVNTMPGLDTARNFVLAGNTEALQMLYPSVSSVLSQLIRTAFIPAQGCVLLAADFAAIEARVIAWLARETWRMDVFNSHGKIYEASAAQMFKIPIEQIGKGSPYRKKGKIAELALGYQGGVNALLAMGSEKMGIPSEDLPGMVMLWRKANPGIVRLWSEAERCAVEVLSGARQAVIAGTAVKFTSSTDAMYVHLPSGRVLSYYGAALRDGKYGRPEVVYMGMDQTTKRWAKIGTYGGKLVENIIQAIARDCLAEAMLRLDSDGISVVMHVHDEIIAEVARIEAAATAERMAYIMGLPMPWAPGLPLKADVDILNYYKKED